MKKIKTFVTVFVSIYKNNCAQYCSNLKEKYEFIIIKNV